MELGHNTNHQEIDYNLQRHCSRTCKGTTAHKFCTYPTRCLMASAKCKTVVCPLHSTLYKQCCILGMCLPTHTHTPTAGTVSSLPQWDSSSYVSTTAPTSSVTACKEELRQSEGGTDTSVLTWYCRTGVDCAVNTLCFQVFRHNILCILAL